MSGTISARNLATTSACGHCGTDPAAGIAHDTTTGVPVCHTTNPGDRARGPDCLQRIIVGREPLGALIGAKPLPVDMNDLRTTVPGLAPAAYPGWSVSQDAAGNVVAARPGEAVCVPDIRELPAALAVASPQSTLAPGRVHSGVSTS